jgi:hypothetical protein
VNAYVKAKILTLTFTIGTENVKAMIREVSWPLASCTIRSRADKAKTINVNMDDANPPRTSRAPSTVKSSQAHPVR